MEKCFYTDSAEAQKARLTWSSLGVWRGVIQELEEHLKNARHTLEITEQHYEHYKSEGWYDDYQDDGIQL